MAAFVNRKHAFANERTRSAKHRVLLKCAEQSLHCIVQTSVDE
jgi:hypothetical protein